MSIQCSGSNISYVAVGRSQDQTIVASYLVDAQDYNKLQYVNTVREVLSAPDFASKVAPGSRYRLVGATSAFNFVADDKGKVFIAITASDYPERLVFPMLTELIEKFNADPNLAKADVCKAGALNKKSKSLFSSITRDYDDPAQKDKLSAVQAKVEDVKLTMQSNIDGMLRNMDKTERIESDTQALQDQAKLFDSQAGKLKSREQWKSRKLTIAIILIVLIILAVLIFTLVNQ